METTPGSRCAVPGSELLACQPHPDFEVSLLVGNLFDFGGELLVAPHEIPMSLDVNDKLALLDFNHCGGDLLHQ